MSNQNILTTNLIGLLGIEALPDEEKIQILEKASELLEKRIMLRVAEMLSYEDQKKIGEMGEDPIKILEFIAEKVPNFEEIMKEETVKLKEEMLQVAKEAV